MTREKKGAYSRDRNPIIMMTRRLFSLFSAVAVLFSAASVSHAQNPKIATVDMQKLFREYYRTARSQERFSVEYAKIQKKVGERRGALQRKQFVLASIMEQLRKGGLDEEQKAGKQSEARMLDQELKMMGAEVQRFSAQERQKVDRLKASSMMGIMQEIRQKVVAHAKKQGYDFVFDRSGKNTNQVTFFIYLKDAKDITALMLKELNKSAPGANE